MMDEFIAANPVPTLLSPYNLGLVFVILPIGLWLYTALAAPSSFPTLRGQRILLLTAHPDDEAMFFAPTVLALTQPHLGNRVKVLCLSSGNAKGLGQVRRKELAKACAMLGVQAQDVACLDVPDLQDSMTAVWPPKTVASLLEKAFVQAPASSRTAKKECLLDVIVTFDARGVSGHVNHKACLQGSLSFLDLLRKQGKEDLPALYSLRTTGLLRKYTGVADVPVTVVLGFLGLFLTKKRLRDKRAPSWLVFVAGPAAWRTAWKAMTTAHVSQMLWFRYAWISISRYMVVNDLVRVDT